MTHDDALRKVAALLRLAERAGTQAEAETAAAHAESLMTRFEISRDAILDGEPQAPAENWELFNTRPDGHLDTGARLAVWKIVLASRLARLHACIAFTAHRTFSDRSQRTVEIVGRPSQVETVRYLYALLSRMIDQLATHHSRGMGLNWRSNFARGAAEGVCERMKEAREQEARAIQAEQAHNPLALVRVNSALLKLENERHEVRAYAYRACGLGRASLRGGPRNESAREAGRREGRNLSIARARGAIGSGS